MREVTAMQMVGLPWRWQGPSLQRDSEGNEWMELRIEELPDFFVAGRTKDEVVAEAATALEAFLQSYLSAGEPMPLPKVFEGLERVPDEYRTGLDLKDLQAA